MSLKKNLEQRRFYKKSHEFLGLEMKYVAVLGCKDLLERNK